MSGRIDDCRYKRYNNDVRMHIYFYEVNDVQNGFLRRRIGLLMCMIGLVMIFAAVSYSELDKIHTVSADTSAQYTLIIDPGHGGDDGGAVSADGVQEADINLAIKGLKSGAADFITKPWDNDELMHKLKDVLDKKNEIISLDEMEREHIRRAIDHCHGNLTQVAGLLGITRQTLYNKMKRL